MMTQTRRALVLGLGEQEAKSWTKLVTRISELGVYIRCGLSIGNTNHERINDKIKE